MIIPLMVDYDAYPLAEGHDRLRTTAERSASKSSTSCPNSARRLKTVADTACIPATTT